MRPDPPETKQVIERLRREIDDLSQKNSQALDMAIHVGFSREEKRRYDERLDRIQKLQRELSLIKESTRGAG